MTMRRGSGTAKAGGLGVDAASFAMDVGGLAAAQEHDITITAVALAARVVGA